MDATASGGRLSCGVLRTIRLKYRYLLRLVPQVPSRTPPLAAPNRQIPHRRSNFVRPLPRQRSSSFLSPPSQLLSSSSPSPPLNYTLFCYNLTPATLRYFACHSALSDSSTPIISTACLVAPLRLVTALSVPESQPPRSPACRPGH